MQLQQWTRLRAPMALSQYSKQATTRDWTNPVELPLIATLDPATNNLYVTSESDVQDGDRFRDGNGHVWKIAANVPDAVDIHGIPQNPIQAWSNPSTSWAPGVIVRIERVTP